MGGKGSCCRHGIHAPGEPQPLTTLSNQYYPQNDSKFSMKDEKSPHLCAEYLYMQQNNYTQQTKIENKVEPQPTAAEPHPMPPNSPPQTEEGPPVHYLTSGQSDSQQYFERKDPDSVSLVGDEAFDLQNYPIPTPIALGDGSLTPTEAEKPSSNNNTKNIDNDSERQISRDETAATLPD